MSLRVIAPGPVATVQDRGRFGYRAWGVPTSGPFDPASAAIANAMLGNSSDCAVVELTGFGGIYEAEMTLAVALAGAPMRARVDRADGEAHAVTCPATTTLRAGDRLHLGAAATGYRAYLAVRGGWLVPERMRSRSSETPLVAGQNLPAEPGEIPDRWTDLGRIEPDELVTIRYIDGPDADRIEPGALDRCPFRVGRQSDRMGIRLDGDPIDVEVDPERLSTPVAPGAIQVAGGWPLVLGPAGGTMGGYPHVGHVISADLGRLGQARPGSDVRFQRVELQEARRLDGESRKELARLVLILATAVRGVPDRRLNS
ncbi:MAG: allophanate hydrolase subunit 2 [Planctomycetota bacterium]|nr:allophanate hydrolase subunit 2 [Planctomycetota bacterium]